MTDLARSSFSPENDAMKETKGKPKKDAGPKGNASKPSEKTGAITTSAAGASKKK